MHRSGGTFHAFDHLERRQNISTFRTRARSNLGPDAVVSGNGPRAPDTYADYILLCLLRTLTSEVISKSEYQRIFSAGLLAFQFSSISCTSRAPLTTSLFAVYDAGWQKKDSANADKTQGRVCKLCALKMEQL